MMHLIPKLHSKPPPFYELFIFSSISTASNLSQIKQIHSLLFRLGFHQSNFIISKIIRRISNLNIPFSSYHTRIFNQVPSPNSFLFTSLIRASPEPFHVYNSMRRHYPHLPPLSFTFSALLKSCKTLHQGLQIHSHTLFFGGFDADLHVQNTLLTFYIRFGELSFAQKVFDEMPIRDSISWTSLIVSYSKNGDMGSAELMFSRIHKKDAVAWTAMVTGYMQNTEPNKALEKFEKMIDAEVKVDEVSLVGAISSVSQLGSVKLAFWIHNLSENILGAKDDVVVGSALIDMYSKCGLINEACNVFKLMNQKNVYSYTAMINALASHSRADEAVNLFEDMISTTTIKPNPVTFIGVLTACSHAKKVEKGRYYFSKMIEGYGIAPSQDHYVCMVDLLGRAGLIEEALGFVQSMSVEPSAGIWGALLGSCRIYKNVDVAEIASGRLFELEPNGVGNYIILCNIYASMGMWRHVSRVRSWMKERGLRKTRSLSWIETKDGTVHEFYAGEVIHEREMEIKETLDAILERVKVLEGYEAVLSSLMYDVGDDEKKRILKGHSEKYAMAFGVLVSEVGESVRIMKNLRMCEDCHLVMRLSSKVVGREFVVRDNTRFHHFQNGVCSCGDFW